MCSLLGLDGERKLGNGRYHGSVKQGTGGEIGTQYVQLIVIVWSSARFQSESATFSHPHVPESVVTGVEECTIISLDK